MLHRMKFKIKHKLFFTLLLTSIIVSASMFLFLQWNFDKGFVEYINNQELEQLDALGEVLTEEYAERGDWDFMVNNQQYWLALHNTIFRPRHIRENRFEKRPFVPPPRKRRMTERNRNLQERPNDPPMEPRGIRQRIALFDAEKNRIVGNIEASPDSRVRPISHEGEVVGFLGLAPLKEISDTGDLLFLEQQTETFAFVTLAMVIFSLIISFPIASHLLRPINTLTGGTLKLIAGFFKTRIPITTKDELGQLSEHFNTLALTLEENEKARQHWVADISHELRTPLAVLQGEIEAIQDGVRRPEPEVLEALHNEIKHLTRLVNDLYELSMTDIGALNYRKMPVDPMGILLSAIEVFEHRFTQKNLKLNTDISVLSPCILLADPDRLQQLFSNLLENSLRYTAGPGVLEITACLRKDKLVIEFSDTQPGVESHQLPRLFERLYRAEGSRNRRSGGAGLGMSICRNIVEAHQGKIKAASSPKGGLLISIVLPLNV